MPSSLDTLLAWLRGDRGRLWSRSRRRAALREIEEQFHLRLTEKEVFEAATLFLALLADHALIDKEAVARQVRAQWVEQHDNDEEEKKSVA